MRRWIAMVLVAVGAAAAGLPAAAEETWQRVKLDRGMTELSLWGSRH